MKKSRVFELMAWTIGVIALALAYKWFGWQLVVVLMVAFWGRNLERRSAEELQSELIDELESEDLQSYKSTAKPVKKSKFQQRLEDAANKRNN